MRLWILIITFLAPAYALAYSFANNTECIACNGLIRCGQGIYDVIRFNDSSRALRVEDYCKSASNQRNPRQNIIREVFGKTRFTYGEYLSKQAELREKNINVEAKPLIHSRDFVPSAAGGSNLLAEYSDYVLKAIDPEKDERLDVSSDGMLTDTLNRQPANVREASAPKEESRRPLVRSGAWVSPQNEGYQNPISTTSSTERRRVSLPPPTATPIVIERVVRVEVEDSFRLSHCKRLSEIECLSLYQNQNPLNAKTQNVPAETKTESRNLPSSKTAAGRPTSSSVVTSLPPSMPMTIPSPQVGADSYQAPSVAASSLESARLPASAASRAPPPPIPKIEKLKLKVPDIKFEPAKRMPISVEKLSPPLMSPVPGRQVGVTLPSGEHVTVELGNESGSLFSNIPGAYTEEKDPALKCNTYDQWLTSAKLVHVMKSSRIPSEGQVRTLNPLETNSLDAIIRPEEYCKSGPGINTAECDFGKVGCSCNTSAVLHFIKECKNKFDITGSSEQVILKTCQNNLTELSEIIRKMNRMANPKRARSNKNATRTETQDSTSTNEGNRGWRARRHVRNSLHEFCNTKGCKNLFSDRIQANLKKKENQEAILSEYNTNIKGFLEGLELNNSLVLPDSETMHCSRSEITITPLLPSPENSQQSPVPEALR